MGWKCKGICIRYKVSGRYASGKLQCRVCGMFIKWSGARCPCCGGRLRTKRRTGSLLERGLTPERIQ